MYIPNHFRVTDQSIIEKFINLNGFATIVTQDGKYPMATHIPVELETNEKGERVLWGHISRANPQSQYLDKNGAVLVVFLSDLDRYISSSWYNYQDAPTWNYMSVQVCGKLQVMGQQKTWESVRRLTSRYESASEHPISLDSLPKEVQAQMSGLIAFEISMDQVDAAFKMSQNRDDANFENILVNLRKSGDRKSIEMADMMEKIRAANKVTR